MKVLKFGGTSMGTSQSIQLISNILSTYYHDKETCIVVCSAMSGITKKLILLGKYAEENDQENTMKTFHGIKQIHIDTAKALSIEESFLKSTKSLFNEIENIANGILLIHEFSPRSRAYLCSMGERLSTRLLDTYLQSKQLPSQQLDSHFIKTKSSDFLEDDIDWECTIPSIKQTLIPILNKGLIPIVTGFFATNQETQTSLLGRGGSDYTGAIVAVSLDIQNLEIWTDVDGFLSADPKIIDDAQIIQEIGYQEASELCFFGAKVLHPKTIRPIIDKNGSVWIKNTFKPSNQGTKITLKAKESRRAVISISSKEVIMVSLDLFASQKSKHTIFKHLFNAIDRFTIPIDMIAASEAEISFCMESKFISNKQFMNNLKNICPYYTKNNRSIVCIVSPKEVKGQIGIAGKIFTSISNCGISVEMYSQNASEIAQLVLINSKDSNSLIKNLHSNLVTTEAMANI